MLRDSLPITMEGTSADFAFSAGRRLRQVGPLLPVAVAFAGGIALDGLVGGSLFLWWFLALIAFVGWAVFYFWKRRLGFAPWVSVGMLLVAVAATGGGWHHFCFSIYPKDSILTATQYEPIPAAVRVQLLESPRFDSPPPFDPFTPFTPDRQSRCRVRFLEIRNGREWQAASGEGQLLVSGKLLTFHAGDRVAIFGTLGRYRPPQNPGQTDRAMQTRREGIQVWLQTEHPDCMTLLDRSPYRGWIQIVEIARAECIELLEIHLPKQQIGMAKALLLGDRRGLSIETKEAFRVTGMMHVLAISGLHVGIVAGLLFLLLRLGWLPRIPLLLGIVAIVGCYALLCETRAPIVRATILVAIACGAGMLRRRNQALHALAATAWLILLFNPVDLFRIGAQLSFLAVATILLVYPIFFPQKPLDALEKFEEASRSGVAWLGHKLRQSVWQCLGLSGVITLMTGPLMMAHFHLLAPATIVLTPLLMLPLSLALIGGLGVLATGWWCPPLAWICAGVSSGGLWIMEQAVQFFAEIPGSFLWVESPPSWWLSGFYLVTLGGVVTVGRQWMPRRWGWTLMIGWIAWGFGFSGKEVPENSRALTCTFLAVGHGNAIVIQTPDGKTLLYDAGRLGQSRRGAEILENYFFHEGITQLDAVFLSHADTDHLNAIPHLIEKIPIRQVFVPPGFAATRERLTSGLIQRLKQAGIPLRTIRAGAKCSFANDGAETVALNVLHPIEYEATASDNANSLVLQVEWAGRMLLLPGDLEPPGIYHWLYRDRSPGPCDVLLAPHHGSWRSDPWAMAEAVRPKTVVISRGDSLGIDRTISAYEAKGAEVFSTQISGAIRICLQREKVERFYWAGDRWEEFRFGGIAQAPGK
ncbi:Hypothetical protein PBC10988_27330 [Planctomycetales bacterium 10988]|nr:Hypothetical protein PBC10988_27330 [Planctomycetales bacterium 10988]